MDIKVLSAIVGDAIRCCYLHPVKLEIVFRKFQLGLCWDIFKKENIPFDEELIKTLNWNTVIFNPATTHLQVYSMKNGNKDNRGGGCGYIEELQREEFGYEIKNPGGITLKELTEAVYRMKGSKYDYWYEMYSGIEIDGYDEEDPEYITIEAKFDYGS